MKNKKKDPQPFRKTKFVLIQSQNGNLSISTREEETRFRFKFETTVRYAETIRSDLKTDSDTHTHTHTHIRGRIKQRNLLYSGRGCGTWPRNSKPFLECIRSYALSYTTFHLSLLRPSLVEKKKKEKTNFPSTIVSFLPFREGNRKIIRNACII